MAGGASGDVVVVGSGVAGLTTALVLAERGLRVRVWTREPAEETTSAVAGALWWPYRIRPIGRARAWALRSLEVYEELAARPAETGVRMVEGVLGEVELDEKLAWLSARLPGLRAATPGEYGGTGVRARLPLIDMPVQLAWLRGRLIAAGGTVEDRTVASPAEGFAAAPVVVNCTGLGARELVPDPAVRPVRGQLVVVENPGIDTWLVSTGADGEMAYLFPQPGRLLLGGTADEDAWSLTPDPAVAGAIVGRCAALGPVVTFPSSARRAGPAASGPTAGDRRGAGAGAPGGAAAGPGHGPAGA